ncbi:MAG TPA: triose-phosphate isomerase [Bacteroidota bacterium]|nr:triose-phosphate isomerase [Bacteroidota bacterium]
MRKKFVAGNWKMNKDLRETGALIAGIRELMPAPPKNADVAVCPPFTALESAARALEGSAIGLGAQDMSGNDDGAYTGEVSGRMLAALGCRYVILGHSERRQYFLESDELVNAKAKKALSAGLVPIVCVGETLAEREGGLTETRIALQVRGSLAGLTSSEVERAVIAYEPVWAIGTGKTATPDQADQVHRHIRSLLMTQFDSKTSEKIRILYGGSVNADNAAELFSRDDIDGGLIGGASLKPESFHKICAAAG